jgi:predicted nucleotidyltransferase
MGMKQSTTDQAVMAYRYRSPHIPLSAIRRFARRIAERFQPEKIILFGSYAYGTPHADSDVDLLVVMAAADEINQSIRITLAFQPVFPLDLIVRTPERLRRRLADGDWFLREIVDIGKVLYEASNAPMGAQGRRGLASSPRRGGHARASQRCRLLPLAATARPAPVTGQTALTARRGPIAGGY